MHRRTCLKVLGGIFLAPLALAAKPKPRLELHSTTTGRMSSKNPNIQNVPRNPEYLDMYTLRASQHFGVPYHRVTPDQRLMMKTWYFAEMYGGSPALIRRRHDALR